MRVIRSALAIAVLFTTPAPAGALTISPAVAAERLPTFPKKTDYGEARKSLIAVGWQPAMLPEFDKCDDEDNRCQGRPEMVVCSGTGAAPCIFAWKRSDTLVEILTRGDPAVVSGVRCRAGCR